MTAPCSPRGLEADQRLVLQVLQVEVEVNGERHLRTKWKRVSAGALSAAPRETKRPRGSARCSEPESRAVSLSVCRTCLCRAGRLARLPLESGRLNSHPTHVTPGTAPAWTWELAPTGSSPVGLAGRPLGTPNTRTSVFREKELLYCVWFLECTAWGDLALTSNLKKTFRC